MAIEVRLITSDTIPSVSEGAQFVNICHKSGSDCCASSGRVNRKDRRQRLMRRQNLVISVPWGWLFIAEAC